jgi:hypothetical protein
MTEKPVEITREEANSIDIAKKLINGDLTVSIPINKTKDPTQGDALLYNVKYFDVMFVDKAGINHKYIFKFNKIRTKAFDNALSRKVQHSITLNLPHPNVLSFDSIMNMPYGENEKLYENEEKAIMVIGYAIQTEFTKVCEAFNNERMINKRRTEKINNIIQTNVSENSKIAANKGKLLDRSILRIKIEHNIEGSEKKEIAKRKALNIVSDKPIPKDYAFKVAIKNSREYIEEVVNDKVIKKPKILTYNGNPVDATNLHLIPQQSVIVGGYFECTFGSISTQGFSLKCHATNTLYMAMIPPNGNDESEFVDETAIPINSNSINEDESEFTNNDIVMPLPVKRERDVGETKTE